MRWRKNAIWAVVAVVALLIVGTLAWRYLRPRPQTKWPVETTTVQFGMLPYGDHTYAIIGVKKGWFQEVGINLEYRPVKVEDTIPFLLNGSLDVGSCSPGVIIAAHDTNPGVVSFVFGDIFQGYAIMAQPNKGYKSVAEFVGQGLSANDAIKAAAQQLRGRAFAYPSEAAIKPFIDLVLRKGNLTRQDFQSLVLDDPLTVNAMRDHKADFQVGGVPSHIVLEREGFKPIITSNDLASAATPSPQSEELASIFTDGWATTREYYAKHRDIVLRMASVNFRITKFIKDSPDEALAIHMPYLSQVTGQPFTAAEGRIIYTSLDPFFTFEAQRDWYHNTNSPYYYENLNGAIINSFVKQGVFKNKPPQVSDVIVAHEVYAELERLKEECDRLFVELDKKGGGPLADQARKFYDAYNYFDAEALARAALQSPQK